MKVYLSNYRNHWLSPYTILEKIFFWREIDYDEPMIDRLANILDPFCQALLKFLDFVHPKVTYVKIDRWDTWSMDSTLAPIILPMLKQLRASNHGSGFVDLEDVPEHLRYSTYEQWDSQDCFDFYHDHKVKEGDCDNHARWNWVLDEMIWAFEQICDDDHDAQFHTGVHDMKSVPCAWDENGKPTLYTFEEGPNHTAKYDAENHQKHNDRINNGTRLFGKYYRGLWD
jgi:hypothetical protein